jgi:hypothetical protein
MFWGIKIMDWVLKVLKNERISFAALVLVVCGLYWVHSWADERFAKVENLVSLQSAVDLGFESISIENASQEIRDIKLSKQIAQATGASDTTVKQIDERLAHAVSYKNCLVERGSNCEHLRDVE